MGVIIWSQKFQKMFEFDFVYFLHWVTNSKYLTPFVSYLAVQGRAQLLNQWVEMFTQQLYLFLGLSVSQHGGSERRQQLVFNYDILWSHLRPCLELKDRCERMLVRVWLCTHHKNQTNTLSNAGPAALVLFSHHRVTCGNRGEEWLQMSARF